METEDFTVFEKGSQIWQYFLRGTGNRKGFAKCRVIKDNGEPCNVVLSMGSKFSTGSLNNHARLVHKIDVRKGSRQDIQEANDQYLQLQKALLTEIRKRPQMWNPELPVSRVEKRAVRQEIASVLDITEDRVALNWRKLQEQYRKYSSKDPITSRSHFQWPLKEEASFLDEIPEQYRSWTQDSDNDTNCSFQESANTIPQKKPKKRKQGSDTLMNYSVKQERSSNASQFESFDSDEYFSDSAPGVEQNWERSALESDQNESQHNRHSAEGPILSGGYPGALSTEVYVLAKSLRGKDQHNFCQQISDFARSLIKRKFEHCERVYDE